MKILIHRGAEEIGGNCIELESQGKKLLLDMGTPLSGMLHGEKALPNIAGLREGGNPDLLGIVISHPHADHYGLVGFAHPTIPVYIGAEAYRMLKSAMSFGSFGADFEIVKHYQHRKPFEIGPFHITPYLADHSAFDAYSFLIEADGKRIFYSGDLRGHGWKNKIFEELLNNPPENVDAMMLEGTTLGREESNHTIATEAELVLQICDALSETNGIALAGFSGQNIDRLVTFYKAALSSKRIMVIDLYIAQLLKAIGRDSLPSPNKNLRVFLPKRMKSKIMREKNFDLVKPFYPHRIYADELADRKDEIVMSFRSSMMEDLEQANCLKGARLIYSMWPGYIERQQPNLHDWCNSHQIDFQIIHTSGHASKHDLNRLVEAINPKILIPIHTFAHDSYHEFGCPLKILNNKEYAEL